MMDRTLQAAALDRRWRTTGWEGPGGERLSDHERAAIVIRRAMDDAASIGADVIGCAVGLWHGQGPRDWGQVPDDGGARGLEATGVVSTVPTVPDPAVIAAGRVVRRSRRNDRNTLVLGAGRDADPMSARDLEDLANLWLRANPQPADAEYPAGIALVGTADESWSQVSPPGLAGLMPAGVAWVHETLADAWAREHGMSHAKAAQLAKDLGADAPQRRTDRGQVAWSASEASTQCHTLRDAKGREITDDAGKPIKVPTVLAEVGAWREGRHWTVTCYGTNLTAWAPVRPGALVETHHATGCGAVHPLPRRIIIGANGRPVRGPARRRGIVRAGERGLTWQSAGTWYAPPDGVVIRLTTTSPVKRARDRTDGLTWRSAERSRLKAPTTRKARAETKARATKDREDRTRVLASPDDVARVLTRMERGDRVILRHGDVTATATRLDQTKCVVRVRWSRLDVQQGTDPTALAERVAARFFAAS